MLIHSTVVCVFKVNSTHSMKYRIMVGGQLQRWGSLHDMQWDDYLKITVSCSDNSCSIETTMVVVIIHNRDNNLIDLSAWTSAIINDMSARSTAVLCIVFHVEPTTALQSASLLFSLSLDLPLSVKLCLWISDSRSLNNTTSQHTLQHRKNIYPPDYQPDITSKQSVWDFLSDETYEENTTFGGGDEDLISLLETRDVNLELYLVPVVVYDDEQQQSCHVYACPHDDAVVGSAATAWRRAWVSTPDDDK